MEDFIFANMSKLQIIVINGASMNGRIPEAVGNLFLLQRLLACGMNGPGLSGNLPKNLGNMTDMLLMCLAGNSFTGQIPRSISKLKKLVYLDLRNAPGNMSGFIEYLFSIIDMQILYVSGIELQGTMPAIFPTRLVMYTE
jgi:hypothetical protein